MGHRHEALRGQDPRLTSAAGPAKLTIAGRDKTKLVDGLARQVKLVRTAIAAIAPGLPVQGALCFVDADLPLLSTPTINAYPLPQPTALAKQLNAKRPKTKTRVLQQQEPYV